MKGFVKLEDGPFRTVDDVGLAFAKMFRYYWKISHDYFDNTDSLGKKPELGSDPGIYIQCVNLHYQIQLAVNVNLYGECSCMFTCIDEETGEWTKFKGPNRYPNGQSVPNYVKNDYRIAPAYNKYIKLLNDYKERLDDFLAAVDNCFTTLLNVNAMIAFDNIHRVVSDGYKKSVDVDALYEKFIKRLEYNNVDSSALLATCNEFVFYDSNLGSLTTPWEQTKERYDEFVTKALNNPKKMSGVYHYLGSMINDRKREYLLTIRLLWKKYLVGHPGREQSLLNSFSKGVNALGFNENGYAWFKELLYGI